MSDIPLHKPVINDLGLVAQHDHACCVCHEKHSVLSLNTGVFQPCWTCQQSGMRVVKKLTRKGFINWLIKAFGD